MRKSTSQKEKIISLDKSIFSSFKGWRCAIIYYIGVLNLKLKLRGFKWEQELQPQLGIIEEKKPRKCHSFFSVLSFLMVKLSL